MIKVLIIIFVILGVLFLVGGGYLLGVANPTGESSSLSPSPAVVQVSPLPEASASIPPPSGIPVTMSDKATPGGPQLGDVLGPNDAQRAIEKAVESANFDKVEPNLANKVTLITYGTSCCGETSDSKEIIDFISGKAKSGQGPWVFNPSDAKYADLKNESDFFAVAKSGEALLFKNNEDNKLESVTFYGDYRLAAN